ncbi:ATP-binding protein [Streptomyces stramineus]|uniref:Histidine kinase/HSP90-like ATPase domain-containing protein n=1 Tax=Streptomyces stramineus TaxID=173861 RepID=A0ABN1A2Y8_9ACTN
MATVSPENLWSYTLNLPHDPRSTGIARLTLRGILRSHGRSELVDDAVLLTSELVTNAYRNSEGPAELRVRERPEVGVRISVWDTNPTVPAPFDTPPGDRERAGRAGKAQAHGLLIVRFCAENWGSHTFGGPYSGVGFRGKFLWCELGGKSPSDWGRGRLRRVRQ